EEGAETPYKHEVINALLCLLLSVFLLIKPNLRDLYKLNLIPIIILQFIGSSAFVAQYCNPYEQCYKPETWLRYITDKLIRSIYVIKPFFILNCLIREPLSKKFSRMGLLSSILIPVVLYLL
ncbi:hypothetical protein PMAYCL1PPCAC_05197, partial [Pristionchus mayeri]